MDKDLILKTAAELILKSKLGLEAESPKIDFKRQWYNLKSKSGINEFLKDVTAIVNTVGLDGLIIIGWDDKTCQYHSAKFRDSNLRDSNEVTGIIAKHCSNLFDFAIYDEIIEGNPVSIIHLPPSFSKPVIIKNYQSFTNDDKIKKEIEHCIWVRKGTSVHHAAKHDLEMMYYDRKNIIQEEKLEIYVTTFIDFSSTKIAFQILIQNFGVRPVAITGASLEFGDGVNRTVIPAVGAYEIVQGALIDQKSASVILDPNKSVERIFAFPKQIGVNNLKHQMLKKAFGFAITLSTYQGHLYRADLDAHKFIENNYIKKSPKML